MTDNTPNADTASKGEGKNGIYATALSIISCIMGGGIVSIPYAFAAIGFLNGFML